MPAPMHWNEESDTAKVKGEITAKEISVKDAQNAELAAKMAKTSAVVKPEKEADDCTAK